MPECTAGFPFIPTDQEVRLAPNYPYTSAPDIEEEIRDFWRDERSLWPKDIKVEPKEGEEPYDPGHWEIYNSWQQKNGDIIYIRVHTRTKEREWGRIERGHMILQLLTRYINCSKAWTIKAEGRAVKKLRSCIQPFQFRQYILTGMFWEISKKSKLCYMFRRGRPVLVVKHSLLDSPKALCSLCYHPVGHFSASWAGCLCPTDDVIAGIKLLRADEHMFWRKCEIHTPMDPQGGYLP